MSQMVKNTPAKQEPPVQFLGLEVMLEKGLPNYPVFLGFPYGSLVKNLPAMWETSIRFLGSEDPLEEGMATHSSILAQRIPMDRGAWLATVQELDMTKQLSRA